MSWKVFFLAPNLLGYLRVVLAFVGLYLMPTVPNGLYFYLGSHLVSVFDGLSAKFLNQSSSFGLVRGMVSDRTITLGLTMLVSMFYPDSLLMFQFLVMLDISSHWFQHYCTVLHSKSSHKTSTNVLLRWFYWSQIVVGGIHFGNELFLVGLYAQYFTTGPYTVYFGYQKGRYEWMVIVFLPFFAVRHLMNLVQLLSAAKEIASFDEGSKIPSPS